MERKKEEEYLALREAIHAMQLHDLLVWDLEPTWSRSGLHHRIMRWAKNAKPPIHVRTVFSGYKVYVICVHGTKRGHDNRCGHFSSDF